MILYCTLYFDSCDFGLGHQRMNYMNSVDQILSGEALVLCRKTYTLQFVHKLYTYQDFHIQYLNITQLSTFVTLCKYYEGTNRPTY